MKRMSHKVVKVYSQIIRFIFKKILRHTGCVKIKKQRPVMIFLVEGWSIEGRVTKMVEWIVMDFGLLILHKTKVLII